METADQGQGSAVQFASATVCRYLLGARLARLREDAGLTLQQVAGPLYLSASKLCRIEAGVHRVSVDVTSALLTRYGLGGGERRVLLDLAERAHGKARFHAYGDVATPSQLAYIDVEHGSTRLDVYAPDTVPVLLRTGAYDEAVRPVSAAEQQRRSALLSLRTAAVADAGVRIRVLLGPWCLQLPVGGPEIMREQAAALRDADRSGRVQVRMVAHEDAAAVHGLRGYAVLELPGEPWPLTGSDSPDGVRVHWDRSGTQVAAFSALWDAARPLTIYDRSRPLAVANRRCA